MKVGKTRERLAVMIEDLLGDEYTCDPNDLQVNRGCSKYNDWCSWTGTAYNKHDRKYFIQVCSWDSMKEIIKHKRIVLVSGKLEVGPNELTHSDN